MKIGKPIYGHCFTYSASSDITVPKKHTKFYSVTTYSFII